MNEQYLVIYSNPAFVSEVLTVIRIDQKIRAIKLSDFELERRNESMLFFSGPYEGIHTTVYIESLLRSGRMMYGFTPSEFKLKRIYE